MVNASRVDFDGKLEFSRLEAIGEFARYADSTPEEIVERAAGCEVLITKELPVPKEVIEKLPDTVKLICEAGTGYNNIDLAVAKARGITVCNCPAYSTDSVAHLVISFVLNFSCSLVEQHRMLWKGDRSNFTKCLQVPHVELGGKVLGLIGGSGTIGGRTAEIAVVLGMKVLISSRTPKPSTNPNIQIVTVDELLQQSDFVSLHCPLTPETKHLIDMATLRKMKPTAYLINAARGPIVKEADLIEALQAKVIAGAALDVQDVEPPVPESPLYALAQEGSLLLSPHIGWKRLETRQRLLDLVAGNVAAFVGGSPTNVVG